MRKSSFKQAGSLYVKIKDGLACKPTSWCCVWTSGRYNSVII